MNLSTNEKYQSLLAHCWAAMAVLYIMLHLSYLIEAAIKFDFSEAARHPGHTGLALFCVSVSIYMLLGVLVRCVVAKWFRWFNVVMFGLFTLIIISHQVEHLKAGIYSINDSVQISHHLIGIFATIQAVRWAKMESAK